MDIEKTLEQLGFEEKEAKTYLACLQLGEGNATKIAKMAGLKRSTVYVKLNDLNLKGLIDIVKTETSTKYRATHPSKLTQLYDFRRKQLEEISPMLKTLYKGDTEKPRIQVFESDEAVERLYMEFLEEIECNGGEIFIFSKISQIYENLVYKKILEKFLNLIWSNKIKVILTENDFISEYGKKVIKATGGNYQFRLVKDSIFMNDNMIYGDKMAIFSIKKHIYAILIEDKEIVKTYKNLFMLAWESAKIPADKAGDS